MDVPGPPDESAAMQDVDLATALLAAVAVGTIAFELRREVVPPWRLFVPPLAALAAALTLPPEPRWLGMALAGFVVGAVVGGLRGLSAQLRVDHSWKVVRLRRAAYDGVATTLGIAVLAGVDTRPTVAFLVQHMIFVPFAAIAFFCVGYLTGRSAAIGLQIRGAPHDDMGRDPP